jgi:hypothetical protein
VTNPRHTPSDFGRVGSERVGFHDILSLIKIFNDENPAHQARELLALKMVCYI